MSELTKRSTIYFEPAVHQALKIRAACSSLSLSELVNKAVRQLMREDMEDLAAFEERAGEKGVSYEDFLGQLKADSTL